MIILTGPSASGKTATCLYLQDHYGIKKVITHTTRPMRHGEVNDVDYHFVSKEEFQRMIDNDEFVEHVTFNGNSYGTSKKEVRIDKCMALEINGAMTYKSFNDPKIVLFYMHLDEATCKERMLARGDEPAKVEARIENDKNAFHLTDDQIAKIDINVDTKKYNLEEVSAYIYKKYMETLKARGIDYEKELENL
jgi:guanylate kinase